MSYKAMYYKLFNAVTDVERMLIQAVYILQDTQAKCEEITLSNTVSFQVETNRDEKDETEKNRDEKDGTGSAK